jgi:SAM-dependent methyltransferase
MSERDDWNAHWENFAAAASMNPAQQMRFELVARILTRNGLDDHSRILDIGSGHGDLLSKLRSQVPEAELAGVDVSRHGVDIARRKVPGARLVVADLLEPSPELASLAGWATHAVCMDVIEHVDAPVDLLRAAARCLRENGLLVVTAPGGPMSAFDRHIGHRQHFTRASIEAVLGEGGLAVENTYLSGFPFFNLYRAAVILRGEKLASDVASGERQSAPWWMRIAMSLFRWLFHLNLRNHPWGWQVVAVARKPNSA